MKKLMLGNEAIARGAWEAGVNVVSSYPGTPSTEITENIANYNEIYCEWATNEKVALEVAIGAAFAGGRSMSCMKHVGLNVAADPLFTLSYTGINGGLVVVVADDPGMHSSQNEQDSRFYALSALIPMLEPADSKECLEYIKKGYEISEQFDTPVLVRLTTRIAHARSLVETGERVVIPVKGFKKDASKFVMMPAMAKKRHVIVDSRMKKLVDYSSTSDLNRIEWANRKVGVITSGISYQYSKEVFGDASFLKLGMVHPLPESLIKEFAAGVDELYVVEELEPFIENQLSKMGIQNVKGKELFTNLGELSTTIIREAVYGSKKESAKAEFDIGMPPRPPVMCPGCPHRGVFYTLSGLKVNVSGDIGCYTLGALAPYNAVDACVCMGASISMAHGMEKAAGRAMAKNTVAVIGDSTFMHSGITGLIDVVYNKGTSTVIILDNSITGMTGHQQNPTTGLTIRGEKTTNVDLVKLCEAVGVKRVRVEDPFDMKGFRKAVKEELEADEPSVIIAQRPCALLKSVNYGAQVIIENDKCRKCGNCMRLGCPAINKVGEDYVIDKSQCCGCELCTSMCSFGAIVKEGTSK